MGRLQRPGPPAGRGRAHPSARAGEVRRHLHLEPRRVLHGPRGRPPGPGRRRDHDRRPGRAHPVGGCGRDPGECGRAEPAPVPLRRARPHSRAGRARDPDRVLGPRLRRGARGAVRALPAPDLPRPHAAGGRAGPALPLHLQPVALAGRTAARPGHGDPHLRPGQGPQGDAAALHARGRGRDDVRPAGGRDRPQPRPALPRDGDPRLRHLPRHPRRRLHGFRRGRRPAPGRRGRASPAAVRGGRPGRGRAAR